ncbi:hypothetical protein D039_4852A, partial [Vibrio parahaemolyticus EKP-028]
MAQGRQSYSDHK